MAKLFSDYLTAVCKAVLSCDGRPLSQGSEQVRSLLPATDRLVNAGIGLARLMDVRDPEVQSAVKQASPALHALLDLAMYQSVAKPLTLAGCTGTVTVCPQHRPCPG